MTLAQEIAHDSGALRGKRAFGGGRHLLRHVMFQATLVARHHNLVLNPSPIDCALPAIHTKSLSQPLHANASQSRMRFAHHDRTGAIPQVEDTIARVHFSKLRSIPSLSLRTGATFAFVSCIISRSTRFPGSSYPAVSFLFNEINTSGPNAYCTPMPPQFDQRQPVRHGHH